MCLPNLQCLNDADVNGDAAFANVHEHLRSLTVMPRGRLFLLWRLARLCSELPGDAAELGVFLGGSTMLIRAALPHKRIHAFDSFSGLPMLGPFDAARHPGSVIGHAEGDFAVPDVAPVLSRLEHARIHVWPGHFPESALAVDAPKLCIAHCDADVFDSTAEFLRWSAPRLVCGGLIVLDDFAREATPGVQRAITNFMGTSENLYIFGMHVFHNQCVLQRKVDSID